jgi:S-DNA-T family DNA segregation ATPase FtsK/SpoIIIE
MGIEFTRMQRFAPKLPHSPGGVLGEMIGSGMQPTFGFTGPPCCCCCCSGWVLAAVPGLLAGGGGAHRRHDRGWPVLGARLLRRPGRSPCRPGSRRQARGNRGAGARQDREAPPIRIEPQIVEVQKSERVQKEKQASLFDDLNSELPPLSLLDEAPPAQQTVSVKRWNSPAA